MHRLLTLLFVLPLLALSGGARASASALIDLDSRQTILAENPNGTVNVSGMLPLMTVYTALDQIERGRSPVQLFEMVDGPWPGRDGADARVPFAELLEGLLMTGDPKAADAVLAALKLTPEDFDARMRESAEGLGLKRTTFSYPCGAKGACTGTALETAEIAMALYDRFGVSRVWGGSRSSTLSNGTELVNRNLFLPKSPAISGIYAAPEGPGGTASGVILSENPKGTKNRLRRMLAVVLNAGDSDAMQELVSSLMLRGYRDYDTIELYGEGAVVASIPVYKSESATVPAAVARRTFITITNEQMLTQGSEAFELRVRYASPLIAPIEEKAPVGELEVRVSGKPIAVVPLVAAKAVAEGGFWARLRDTVRLALDRDTLH